MCRYTEDAIRKARDVLDAPGLSWSEQMEKSGLSPHALHCLQHYCKGVPTSEALRRVCIADLLPSAAAVSRFFKPEYFN